MRQSEKIATPSPLIDVERSVRAEFEFQQIGNFEFDHLCFLLCEIAPSI
jgi:hypothetical protein